MSDTNIPKCPRCRSEDLIVERRMDGNAKCISCGHEGPYADCFEDVANKERDWFRTRGYSEADMMYADAAFKKYLLVEQSIPDQRFRRVFMMGYFYGKNK
jgi:hypothetical protein